MRCNLCGSEAFVDMGKRKKVRCSNCGSLERTRVIVLFLRSLNLLKADSKILHLAPEKGLAEFISKTSKDKITFADIQPENYRFLNNVQKLDLCHDLESITDNSYDIIIHNHVLEHVPCNYTYVLFHFHRILKPEGRMLFSIPIMDGYYESSTSPDVSKKDREKRFGQDDHVRRFGIRDLQMSLGKIYDLSQDYNLATKFSLEDLNNFNIPEEARRGYTSHSIFNVGKQDFKLKGFL